MTDNMVSSMTYFDASSFSARSLGEENIAHAPLSEPKHLEVPVVGMRVFRQIFCLEILILSMDVLNDLHIAIEKRSLPTGGWASGKGARAGIETTCHALMALGGDQGSVRRKAIDVLLRTQNPDGSWPAFEGDDPEGCWTTALAMIAFRYLSFLREPVDNAIPWLVDNKGQEGHWFWKWKFRIADRAVQFNPDKYGWPWFPGTVSWVIPTALSLIALKQSLPCCRIEWVIDRIQLGTEMLRDRACPQGGWNAGNGIVFGAALTPHIDATSIALLALVDDPDGTAAQGLAWLRQASIGCSSVYSLAWSVLAFATHRDPALDQCVERLAAVLSKSLYVQCRNSQPRCDRDERS
jgi:prenyltransferase/squalene oxidase-like repeat protein